MYWLFTAVFIFEWAFIVGAVKFLKNMEGRIMAKLQEVLDAITEERAEFVNKLTDLKTQIQDLKDQIANGGSAITEADLDAVLTGIQGIITPEDV